MLRRKMRARERRRIADEAADWVVLFEDAGTEERCALERRFTEWVRQSPMHLKEFLELHAAYCELHQVDRRDLVDVRALTELPAAEVVSLFGEMGTAGALECCDAPRRLSQRPRQIAWGAAAAVVGCVLAGGAAYLWFTARATVYTTMVGEQHSSKLDDGSLVVLNTDSKVRVRYTSTQRRLQLLQGEALFDVGTDARRAFVVDAGNVAVTALGTRFDVYRHDLITDITVAQGAVQISAGPRPVARVNAGEQAQVEAGGRITIRRSANIAAALAWRQRKLVFEDVPLPEVVKELNRYNQGKVILVGDVGQGKRVSATFENDDPESLVEFLQAEWGVEGRSEGGNWVVRQR
jgi:transmembrane sensor